MFYKIADKITRELKENNTIDDEHYEICRYGLLQGLNTMFNLISTLIIGIVLDMLWQSLLFNVFYIPLRSNAGGYHAKTAVRCYIYSVILMIAILLAMKYIIIPHFICVIIFSVSTIIILFICPVEDVNKPLDEMEQKVYRRRTYCIIALECLIFVIAQIFKIEVLSICIVLVFLTMSLILCIGKSKNIYVAHVRQNADNKRK